MPAKLSWLPGLVKLTDFNGDAQLYISEIYKVFKNDFINSCPSYQGKPVFCDKKISGDGKEDGFHHITCETDQITGEKTGLDMNRCERIKWVRAIIENHTDPAVSVWEKDQGSSTKVKFLLENQDFLVVLTYRKKKHFAYFLVTSYYLNWENRKRKLIKERDENLTT